MSKNENEDLPEEPESDEQLDADDVEPDLDEDVDDLDDMEEDLGDDFVAEDSIAETDEDDDEDEDDEDAARPRARKTEEDQEEDDDEEADPDDVEADLDEILRDRMAASDDDEDDDDDPQDGVKPAEVAKKTSDEFVCGTCFLVVSQAQRDVPCPMGDGLESHSEL